MDEYFIEIVQENIPEITTIASFKFPLEKYLKQHPSYGSSKNCEIFYEDELLDPEKGRLKL